MQNMYFDNAATTPLHPEVITVISEALMEYGNPSSIHSYGRKAKGLLEESRVAIAKHLGCTPSEIYFTSCGTESNNIALRKSVDCGGIQHIITSPIEHHAVLGTAQDIARLNPKVEIHLLDVDSKGNYSLDQLEQFLQSYPKALVSIMHANNEIGNLANLEGIGNLCLKHSALFHTDAVQTMGYFSFNLNKSNITMLSASAHKFNGPKGIGFLYIKKGTKIEALITGGGQERNIRAGTENVAYIVGMTKALSLCYEHLEEKSNYIKRIRAHFKRSIEKKLPQISFNGDTENSHYTILSLRIPVSEGAEMFLFNLDLKGISASGGSACSSGASKGSHVMEAIGNNGNCVNLRFSFGTHNTMEEVDSCIQHLSEILEA